MILKEIKNITFFDGNIINPSCQTKNEYWLGSGDSEKYLNAEVFFLNEKTEEVAIKLFEQSENIIHKSLSDWQAPEKGFYKIDLLKLSRLFQFELRENKNGNEEGFSFGHSLELIIKIENDIVYFLIYSIIGVRAPESIYFFGLYEVLIDNEFKLKYI